MSSIKLGYLFLMNKLSQVQMDLYIRKHLGYFLLINNLLQIQMNLYIMKFFNIYRMLLLLIEA